MNNGKGDIERIHRDGISQEPTFQDYVQIVLRGKWMILASFLLVLAGTAVFTFTTSPVYESTATVLVDTKGQQSQMPLFDVTGIGAVKNIKNELEILKSRSLAEAVAVRLIKNATPHFRAYGPSVPQWLFFRRCGRGTASILGS